MIDVQPIWQGPALTVKGLFDQLNRLMLSEPESCNYEVYVFVGSDSGKLQSIERTQSDSDITLDFGTIS